MAQPFNRSKFQPTNMDDAKQKEKKAGLKTFRDSGDKLIYHDIDQGDNKFRIYPFHPEGGGNTYFEYKVVNFLPLEVKKYDEEGKVIEGETEIKRKPVFNAKVHGGYERDLVEEYVKLAKELAEEMNEADQKEYLDKLFHWQNGVKTNRGWVMYTDKYMDGKPVFGILEVGNLLKREINKCASLEDEGSAMDNDPFTHPDDGICLIVNKTGKKLDTSYTCSLDQVKKGKFAFELMPTPLTDDQLARFENEEPLYKMFKNQYKRSDFDKQVEGLQRIDEENKFGVFESEKFLEIIESISAIIPEDKKKDEEEAKKPEAKPEAKPESRKPEVRKPVAKPEPEEEEEAEAEEEETPWEEPEEETKKPEPKAAPAGSSNKELSAKEKIEAIKKKLADQAAAKK